MPLHLDKTLSPSLDARKRCKIHPWFSKLQGRTHFTDHELKCVLMMFSKISHRGTLKKADFLYYMRVMFGILEDSILERLFCALENPMLPGIRFDQWACLLSLYCRGTLVEKITFTWTVYDTMGIGHLTRDNILAMTRPHMGFQYGSCTDEDVNDYADDLIRILDKDGDGKISFGDYHDAIQEKPVLMNCLGRVIPEQHVVHTFLATFSPHIGEKYNVGRNLNERIDITQFRRTSS